MRKTIPTLVNRLRALPRTLRAYRWRLEDMANAAVQALVGGMSSQASHRMRPIPIRVDEQSKTRR